MIIAIPAAVAALIAETRGHRILALAEARADTRLT